MSTLRIERVQLENFRCFDALDVAFEPDLTVMFAENGAGKTALLTALAMSLSLLQPRPTKELALTALRDVRKARGPSGLREPQGTCTIACTATIGAATSVTWSATISGASNKRASKRSAASDAVEAVRQPGVRWPFLGFYGTGRMAQERKPGPKGQAFQDRWDGYTSALQPATTDGPLIDWLKLEVLGDLVRHRRGDAERRYDQGVFQAMQRGTPRLAEIWYEPADETIVMRRDDGAESSWEELSDGYLVFLGLVGDIARRAVILNGMDGASAPEHIEGVVLIDEVDLHLHPSWQRKVLGGLRAAFPKLQFIVTTHSPQVLSSVRNHQVRRLVDGKLVTAPVHVEGRDSNSIMRDYMHTDERDEGGRAVLRELSALIDSEHVDAARTLLASLRERWGNLDPAVIRADGLISDIESDTET